jgi:Flp pilus assembly protein TadD
MAAAYQAAALEPKNAFTQLVLGHVFEARGQLDTARSAYGEATTLDPTWPAPRIAALGLQLRQGDATGALAALRALPRSCDSRGG